MFTIPRTKFVVALTAVALMASSIIAGPFASRRKEESKPTVAWQPNLKVAHGTSVESNRPMLLVFGATWCGPCKRLERETLTHPELAGYINQNFVPIHLDLDEEEKAAEILEVTSVPCVIVLSPNADLLGKYVGFKEPQQFYDSLTEAERLNAQLQQQQVSYQSPSIGVSRTAPSPGVSQHAPSRTASTRTSRSR